MRPKFDFSWYLTTQSRDDRVIECHLRLGRLVPTNNALLSGQASKALHADFHCGQAPVNRRLWHRSHGPTRSTDRRTNRSPTTAASLPGTLPLHALPFCPPPDRGQSAGRHCSASRFIDVIMRSASAATASALLTLCIITTL